MKISRRRYTVMLLIAGLVVAVVVPVAAAPKKGKSRPAKKPPTPKPPMVWTYAPRELSEEVIQLFPRYGVPRPPAVGGGRDSVFFSSPRDHRVLCLDSKTGKLRWQFVAGGPVREAPSFHDGKVYLASDDGWVYCLNAKTGDPVWKHPPPHGRCAIAYGKIISAWPARTNVLIHKDPSANGGKPVAYFGSGTFPHDGAFVTALDAGTGKLVWRNAASGEYPHDWGALSPMGRITVDAKTNYLMVANEGMGGKPFRLSDGFEFHRKARKYRQGLRSSSATIGDATFGVEKEMGLVCRSPAGGKSPRKIGEKVDQAALGDTSAAAKAADTILKQAAITEGYALVLDGQDGALALQLARKTKLQVTILFRDEAKLARAREALQKTGLYGPRITALFDSEKLPLKLPPYFADLIVSESTFAGNPPETFANVSKLLKPIRGVAMLGTADGKLSTDALSALAKGSKLDGWKPLDGNKHWLICRRGTLPGAGTWTHQNADAGNTLSSEDAVLEPPLGVVWYGAPLANKMVNRTGIAPLIFDGVFVSPGAHVVGGYDQYTGRLLWRREMKHVSRRNPYGGSGNFASNGKDLFITYGHQCFRINPWTGETLSKYTGSWGWVAADEKRLYASEGSEVAGKGIRAIDIKSGKVLWKVETGTLQFFNNAVALGDGGMYFVLNGYNPEFRKQGLEETANYAKASLPKKVSDKIVETAKVRDIRILVAVDIKTGKIRYERGIDVTNCGGAPTDLSGIKRRKYPIGLIYKDGRLLHFNITAGGKYWGHWSNGRWAWRGIAVRNASDGSLVWFKPVNFRGRVLVIDKVVHADPFALEYNTGKWIKRTHPISGNEEKWTWCRFNKHCGIYTGSKHFLFGRSGGLGYHDLKRDRGLYTFLHSRPSCWFDTVSGGGLMIKPPQSNGCTCEIAAPFTIALGTVDHEPATPQIYSTIGPSYPAKHVYVDFGGVGDHHDPKGNLYVAAVTHRPFPKIPIMQFRANLKYYEGGRGIARSSIFTKIKNTDTSFAFATRAHGLQTATIPLGKKDQTAKHKWNVALGFAAPPGDKPGQRVFDIKLQGKTVLKGFDPVKEAGAPDTAVWKQFEGIYAGPELVIELVPSTATPSSDQMPILNAAKILRN